MLEQLAENGGAASSTTQNHHGRRRENRHRIALGWPVPNSVLQQFRMFSRANVPRPPRKTPPTSREKPVKPTPPLRRRPRRG
jgi:hypothetical protein